MFLYMFKAEFDALVSLKVPSGYDRTCVVHLSLDEVKKKHTHNLFHLLMSLRYSS